MLKRLPDSYEFLGNKIINRALDPLASFLTALAFHQADSHLARTWWHLCDLAPGSPHYYGTIGVTGLAYMPIPKGTMPPHISIGLCRFAVALSQRAKGKVLPVSLAEQEFNASATLAMSLFPFDSARWRTALVRAASASEWDRDELALTWLERLAPGFNEARTRTTVQGNYTAWVKRSQQIAEGLPARGFLEKAEELLQEQRAHAERTGDAEGLVKSLCNFAEHVRLQNPQLSLAWATEALGWEPWNPYTWSTTIESLTATQANVEAIARAVEAIERFPENPYLWSLAGLSLDQAGCLDEADEMFKEGLTWFPNNEEMTGAHALHLIRRGLVERAKAILNEGLSLYPKNKVLLGHLQEAQKAIVEPGEAPGSSLAALLNASAINQQARAKTALRTMRLMRRRAQRLGREGYPATSVWAIYESLSSVVTEAGNDQGETLVELFLRGEDGDQALKLLSDLDKAPKVGPHVTYAVARADRRLSRNAPYDDLIARRITRRWQDIIGVDDGLAPLAWLGEMRSFLDLVDGQRPVDAASKPFAKLSAWADGERQRGSSFGSWWAQEVQQSLGIHLSETTDLRSMQPPRGYQDRKLDDLEEVLLSRGTSPAQPS